MVNCHICKTNKAILLKEKLFKDSNNKPLFKGNLKTIKKYCGNCQKIHNKYIRNLCIIRNNNTFLETQKTQIDNERQQTNERELKQIPFNCWILEDRENEKKFFEQQNNKQFLKEQLLKDIEHNEKNEIVEIENLNFLI